MSAFKAFRHLNVKNPSKFDFTSECIGPWALTIHNSCLIQAALNIGSWILEITEQVQQGIHEYICLNSKCLFCTHRGNLLHLDWWSYFSIRQNLVTTGKSSPPLSSQACGSSAVSAIFFLFLLCLTYFLNLWTPSVCQDWPWVKIWVITGKCSSDTFGTYH